jgi:hypothetical protein
VRTEEQGDRGPASSGDSQPDKESAAVAYKRPRWDLWLYGTGIAAVILILVTLLSPWVRHEWGLSLGRQATPYTQLGFSNAAALPVIAVRGKGMHVSFVVTNDEGKPLTYRYVVASGSGTEMTELRSGTSALAAGASWDVDVIVTPKCPTSSCQVQVSLPAQGEKIDFRFTYPAATGKKSK